MQFTNFCFNYLNLHRVLFKYEYEYKMIDILIKGKFEIDLGSIYKQEYHEYFNRWACIMPSSSEEKKYDSRSHFPKGYLKCNLSVLAKGDRQQVSCKFPLKI